MIMILPMSSVQGEVGTRSLQEGVSDDHVVESITLNTYFKLSGDFTNWKVTGNKAIDIQLRCLENPDNATILVEHLHADIIIESTKSGFDELTQDSMDDSFHGIQGGFLITTNYSYYENDRCKTGIYNFCKGCKGDCDKCQLGTLSSDRRVDNEDVCDVFERDPEY